jgi:hypothetical protein
MQKVSYPVSNTTRKKNKNIPSWRERNRLYLQMTALGMGILALFILLFCQMNNQATLPGICFALLGVVFNISAWA